MVVNKLENYDLKNVTTKDIIKLIEKHVYKIHESPENGLNLWLDYMVEFFDVSAYEHGINGYVEHIRAMGEKSPELCKATLGWMAYTSDKIEREGWHDTLGVIYEEMYQSKGKASGLGQFFTPAPICDLMAEVTIDKNCGTFLDCACGSGRTLLAAFKQKRDGYFVGMDIDYMSVKMCALNMMIHNMYGIVGRADALRNPTGYDMAYMINEANRPFPSGCYSLRRVGEGKLVLGGAHQVLKHEVKDTHVPAAEVPEPTAVTPEPPKEVPKVKENNKMPEQLCLRFEE